MKIAGYCRVSTKNQDYTGQIEDIKKYAANNGHEIVEIFKEKVPGKDKERPEHARMMSMAIKNKFDAVVVTRLDRFGRSLGDLLYHVEKLDKCGVKFISLSHNIDTTTPTGRLFLQILAAVSEFERELIKERTRAGLERAREKGKQCHRPRKELDVDEIVRLYNDGKGMSLGQLGKVFNCSPVTIRSRLHERGIDTSR